jgi:hypothetical protein
LSEASVQPRHRRGFHIALADALIVIALGAVAFAVRHHVPADGLFYDDAWQSLGALQGSFSEFISVGSTQPGFTVGLMAWVRVFGTETTALVTPALIAGTLGPPALYAALRHLGYARSIASFLAAALVGAEVHIIYSYHVKTYTFDVLVIVGIALAAWHLASRTWRTSMAVAWVTVSIVIASFSSIGLIAVAVVALILALHPSGDRQIRVISAGAQLLAVAALYLAASRTYNYESIHGFFASRGGFIEFDPNPVAFGREVFNHFWNVADVFPGGLPTMALAAGAVGLLVAAWRGCVVVPARFLLLMVIIAVGGSVVGLVPFGPPRFLGRVSLWLVPCMALGLCTALDLVRRRIATRGGAWRTGFDTVAWIGTVLVLVSSFGTEHPYPAGARAAIREVMTQAGPDDAVVITWPTRYSFALYADTPVRLRLTPERQISFLPVFGDHRLHQHDVTTTAQEFDGFVEGVSRVYVVHALINGRRQPQYLFDLAVELDLRGFTRESTSTIESGRVDVWRQVVGSGTAGARASGPPLQRW